MYSLDTYGLIGCYYITSNVYNVPLWKYLHTLMPLNEQTYTIIPPLHGLSTIYQMGSVLAVGTYGKVIHAKRARNAEERHIVIKENETDTTSYSLHEAILHAIVHKTFTEIGLGYVIPELYEVTAHTTGSMCMAMEWVPGSTLLHYFHIYLTRIKHAATTRILPESLEIARKKNDTLILDVLVQIAIYLTILQKKLQFNHRDLKVNNVLIRHTSSRSRSILRRLDHPLLKKPWDCRNDVVVIDFGFSSIHGDSSFEAGLFYKSYPSSMKPGRDLALLIYSIHAFFPLDQYLSPICWRFLQSCMTTDSICILNGIQTDGTPCVSGSPIIFDEGIYHFLQKESVDVVGCNPYTFLKDVNNIL